METGELPKNLQVAVIHCGTNNMDHNTPEDISNGLTLMVHAILKRKLNADVNCDRDLTKR